MSIFDRLRGKNAGLNQVQPSGGNEEDCYLELLGQMISLTDPENEEQLRCARNTLENLLKLHRSSARSDKYVQRLLANACGIFPELCRHKDDFGFVPLEYEKNLAKRRRLAAMLSSGC